MNNLEIELFMYESTTITFASALYDYFVIEGWRGNLNKINERKNLYILFCNIPIHTQLIYDMGIMTDQRTLVYLYHLSRVAFPYAMDTLSFLAAPHAYSPTLAKLQPLC